MVSLTQASRERGFDNIVNARALEVAGFDSAVSLVFAPGRRPVVDAVRAIGAMSGDFMISAEGTEAIDSARAGEQAPVTWIEILANGLTFDLAGFAPARPEAVPKCRHAFGTSIDVDATTWEALTLRPGPHLSSGGTMPPVVRCLAWLGALLAQLPGVQAVVWHPAQIWAGPEYFRRSVLNWIEGGVFPGLGLTALVPDEAGGLRSEGLALFAGMDLRLEPDVAGDGQEAAKVALRLIHWLVEHGGIDEEVALTGPSGEPLVLVPDHFARIIDVRRSS